MKIDYGFLTILKKKYAFIKVKLWFFDRFDERI